MSVRGGAGRLADSRAWPLLAAVVLGGVLIYLLRPILTPFLVAALLAYLADPLVDRLQRLHLGRTPAVVVVFLVLTGILTGIVLLLIPLVGHQIDILQRQIPALIDWLQQTALPWLQSRLGVDPGVLDLERIRSAITEHWRSTGNIAADLVARATRSGLALAGLLATLALIPVVTFYLLRDWDVLLARIHALLPRRIAPQVARLAGECDEVVAAFLRGQLLVMLALGVFYAAGLWLVGLQLAVLIGLISGLAAIIPYLGFVVGILAASLAAVFQFSDWLVPLLLVWAVYLAGQALEQMLLTPVLVGDRLGLHPVAVIFAVLAGGQLFGFVGVLIALPVAAMVMVLLRHAHAHYQGSELYNRQESQDP
ncbi:AI-2E family transporter [Spiribacter halobius]|uniref:AI-2E family transporter n=1 Tax=Sediminicurvatus halobius TaxID=2182432 RepID=A0A2U2N6Z6_9GAMM|nr:AI-2E family transporter [Spiribacter halobius]PWG64966.1 AI-2E family transporter [Spiribacter halobius]UEX78176.1 AI-2E family transporter [Spiribacter halobius]